MIANNKAPEVSKHDEALFSGVEDNTDFDGCKDDSIEPFAEIFKVVNRRPRGELFPYKSKISS